MTKNVIKKFCEYALVNICILLTLGWIVPLRGVPTTEVFPD